MLKKTPYLLVFFLLIILSSAQQEPEKNRQLKLEISPEAEFPLEVLFPDDAGKALSLNQEGVMHLGKDLKRQEKASDGYLLYVQKGIRSERVKVDIAKKAGWADYVFEDTYPLMSLPELEQYIVKNKHLPGIPSAEELIQEGLDLAEANRMLLEKVEELSLHVIELNKRIEVLENK